MKLFDVYPLFNVAPVRGKGCHVYDESGQEYLDFYGGHAVISIGHSHPHFVKRIKEQVEKLVFYSNSVQNNLQIELAEKLGKLSGLDGYQLFLCNSGAEANENALKLASFKNGRTKIVAFNRGFHGRTSAAVNITDNEKIKAPLNKGFEALFFDLNDLEGVEKVLKQEDVCAVIIEGVQGIGGIYIPQPEFLQSLQTLCRKHGTALILDEVQSGYGRTGAFFAFQHAGIEPDLIPVAKGMGNGYPIGGVLIHPDYKASYGLLGTTFGGHHLACAAGLAVLEVLDKENLLPHADQLGKYLKAQLELIPGITEVRGQGLMIGLSFPMPVAELRKHLLYEEKVFTGSAKSANVMRLLPPLNVQRKEVDCFLEKLAQAVRQFSSVTI